MAATTEPTRLADLADSEYVLLTTFTSDGRPKPTPVWAAADEDALVVVTDASTWKVRRARRTPTVTVAACTARGRAAGPALHAVATVVDGDHVPRVLAALRRKYGWKLRLAVLADRLRPRERVGIVLRDVPPPV